MDTSKNIEQSVHPKSKTSKDNREDEKKERPPSFFKRNATLLVIGGIIMVFGVAVFVFWFLKKKKKQGASYEDLCSTFQNQLDEYKGMLHEMKQMRSQSP